MALYYKFSRMDDAMAIYCRADYCSNLKYKVIQVHVNDIDGQTAVYEYFIDSEPVRTAAAINPITEKEWLMAFGIQI